jgi:hypothetical protein
VSAHTGRTGIKAMALTGFLPASYSDQRAFGPFKSAGVLMLISGRMFYLLPHDVRRIALALVDRDGFERLQEFRSTEVRAYDERRCVFVHIPKAAGISVATGLFGTPGGGHTHIGLYQLIFCRSEFKRYFKFAFVRNPWDRLFSAYEFLKAGGLNDIDRAWSQKHLGRFDSFENFVLNWVNERSILSEVHFIPQYKFVCAPFRRKLLVDFVGRYETLAHDFRILSRRINQREATIPHLNRTSGRERLDYREVYTPTMRRVVERVYRNDVELFEYSFDSAARDASVRAN